MMGALVTFIAKVEGVVKEKFSGAEPQTLTFFAPPPNKSSWRRHCSFEANLNLLASSFEANVKRVNGLLHILLHFLLTPENSNCACLFHLLQLLLHKCVPGYNDVTGASYLSDDVGVASYIR